MRVLIAVDGSAECEVSLAVAARWVGVLNAHVYLLQVIDGCLCTRGDGNHDPRCAGGVEAQVLAMKKARIYLDKLVSHYELPADWTRCLVGRSDNPAEEIITIAQNNGIDLIATSGHCRSWLGELAQGSVCSEVVSSGARSLLCLPLARAQASCRHDAVAATRP